MPWPSSNLVLENGSEIDLQGLISQVPAERLPDADRHLTIFSPGSYYLLACTGQTWQYRTSLIRYMSFSCNCEEDHGVAAAEREVL